MKINSFISRLTILILVIFIGFGFVYWWWRDSIAPIALDNIITIDFNIRSGDSVKEIASSLTKSGLIRSPMAFFIYVKLAGFEKKLQAGDFRLNTGMDMYKIMSELTHGTTDIWITIPEGWRVEEIASKLNKDFDIPESEFLKYAEEGYMFPDSYLIPKEATAQAIVAIFKDNFVKKYQEINKKSDTNKLTLDEIVILASIVEREGKTDLDRPEIAGILINRLNNNWPLQVDATLQYVSGYQSSEKTWWKKNLTLDDKNLKSEYNTYANTGLPPKPISNPGLSALKAVVNPNKSEYMFYLHDNGGNIHYARTIEEHNDNIKNFLLN